MQALGDYKDFITYAVETNLIAFVAFNSDGHIVVCNNAFVEVSGYSREEIGKMAWPADFMSPDQSTQVCVAIDDISCQDKARRECTLKRKDGSVLDVLLYLQRYCKVEGENLYYAFIEDIRSYREMQHQVNEMRIANSDMSSLIQTTSNIIGTLNFEELLKAILENTVSVLKADAGSILLAEENMVRVYDTIGMKSDAPIWFSMNIGEGFAGTIIKTGKPMYIEDVTTNPIVLSPFIRDSKIVSTLGVPIYNRNEVIGVLHIDWKKYHPYNLRELNLLQLIAQHSGPVISNARLHHQIIKLNEQSRFYLDLLGHDINNFNQSSLGYLEIARDKLSEGKFGKEDAVLLDKALEAIENSSRLITNLKRLENARTKALQERVWDLCTMLADVKKEFSNVQNREVFISYELPRYECPIIANELVREVFTNIVGNALKHSNPEKPIHIILRLKKDIVAKREYYRIEVEDDGSGVPDKMKNQIFQHFTTTDLRTRGLGLYLVKTLVESYDGKVWVEDRVPGDYHKGSRFVILIPAKYL